MNRWRVLLFVSALWVCGMPASSGASGFFGPPQPVSAKGLHTSIGYWFQEDSFSNGSEYRFRQEQVYSQAGYGFGDRWELYGRIGAGNLRIVDANRSTSPATTVEKGDFTENLNFFGLLGMKVWHPLSGVWGVGAFVQGIYHFREFTDDLSGNRQGVPFAVEMRVKKFWDAAAGIGLQVSMPLGIRVYGGPYLRYGEALVSPGMPVPAVPLAQEERTLTLRHAAGGFGGFEVPIGRGFRFHAEGQYAGRLSAGAAVTFAY